MGLVTGNKTFRIEFWGEVPPDVIAQAPPGNEEAFITAWLVQCFSVNANILGFLKGSQGRVESVDSVDGSKKFRP